MDVCIGVQSKKSYEHPPILPWMVGENDPQMEGIWPWAYHLLVIINEKPNGLVPIFLGNPRCRCIRTPHLYTNPRSTLYVPWSWYFFCGHPSHFKRIIVPIYGPGSKPMVIFGGNKHPLWPYEIL